MHTDILNNREKLTNVSNRCTHPRHVNLVGPSGPRGPIGPRGGI